MFKKIPTLASFSKIQRGNLSILIRKDFKEILQHGHEDLEKLIYSKQPNTLYFEGRRSHPSIFLKNGKRIVIKKYYHGGLLGSLWKDLYIFGSRAFEELILTEKIRSCEIPTHQPICAVHKSIFLFFYKAYLISLEIPNAKDLKNFLTKIGKNPSPQDLILKRRVIRSIGNLIKKFHEEGFFHRDLQLKNILVEGEKVFLIDFDRSYQKHELSQNEKIKNILRLKRSAEKLKLSGVPITKSDQFRFFLAYTEGNKNLQIAIKNSLRIYRFQYLFHKLGWVINEIIKKFSKWLHN
jgi:3-deoxy-D-manno-octulosonic acid kinase